MADEHELNQWMKDKYGCVLDGRARYRVVWSENLTERRLGTFTDYFGHIFLREERAVREVKKYSYLKDRHVLEELVYGINSEMPDTKSSYEPIFVFQDKDGHRLPINRRAIEFFLHFKEQGQKTNPTKEKEEDERKLAEEVDYFEQKLGERMSDPNQMKLVE